MQREWQHTHGCSMHSNCSPKRTHLTLREAAFILQVSAPALRRRRVSNGPKPEWQGGRLVVPVTALRETLIARGECHGFGAGLALDLIVSGRASVPPFPTRNGAPPPITDLIVAVGVETSSCAYRSES